jgi:hypothetical protein
MSSDGIHSLQTPWIVWYHHPTDQDWSPESYRDILELETIEDYCALRNDWNKCLPEVSQGMFFLMRKMSATGKVIVPRWEDPENINGGAWSIRVSRSEAHDVWFKLIAYCIGEDMTKNAIMDWKQINGLSIAAKNQFCIIKIWNRDSSLDNINLLNQTLGEFVSIPDMRYLKHAKCIANYSENTSNGAHPPRRPPFIKHPRL